MKKISILSLHLGYGGIEKMVVSLANLLADKYEVEIACSYKLYSRPSFDLDPRVKVKYLTKYKPNRKEFKEALRKINVFKVISEGIKSIRILHKRRSSMRKYIKTKKCDVMISTRDIFNEWLGEYGSKDILKIGWEHNHYHDDYNYANNIVRSSRKLDYLVLVSKALRDFYKTKLSKTNCKCVFIPNMIDKLPSKCSMLSEKRLISVGRLSEEKGYMDLIGIFSVISKNNPDWVLDIIGDGKEREKLENYIKNLNLQEKITLHGFRDKDYIDNMLNKSSIYLMTSHTESFGIVLIEAMSHGLPCVAFSSAEGANEIIDSGKTGYLIHNRNNRAYIEKVEDLMNDIDSRKRLGKEARKSIKKYHGLQVVEDWYKIIEKK